MERTCIRIFYTLFLFFSLLWIGSPLLAGEVELTLYDIQSLLEESHPSIQGALETYEKLWREWEIARAYYGPSLSITTIPFHSNDQGSSYFETRLQGTLSLLQGLTLKSDLGFSPLDEEYSFQLRLSHHLFQDPLLQSPYTRIEDLEHQLLIVERDLHVLRGEALLEVLKLLFLLEKSKIRYQSALDDLEDAREELEKTRIYLEEGVGEEMGLLLRELRLQQRELEVIRRENSLEDVFGDLIELLGLEDGDVTFPSIVSDFIEPPLCHEEILTQILANSTQLFEAQRKIEREEKALARELENRFPQTTLSGDFGYDSSRGESWSIMLQLSYPLFDGGLYHHAIKEREAALERALRAYEREKKKIEDQVEDLWKALEIREKDIEIASLNHEIKALEVLQSEEMERRGLLDKAKLKELYRELTEVNLELLEAEQAYLLLILELEVLSGRDLVDKMMMR